MENTWCDQAALNLLQLCISGRPLDFELIRYLAEHECSLPVFRILAEGLADRFEPELCNRYVTIFSRLISAKAHEFSPDFLEARYARVRAVQQCRVEPKQVVVISRVTLGADIAITSVVLEAVKVRFPRAAILLAGSEKSAEMFAQDRRIGHLLHRYPRAATLAECLDSARLLSQQIDAADLLVIDPDSRISQLGIFPVCDEARYHFFESRSFGGSGDSSLGELTSTWLEMTFGIPKAHARISPPPVEFGSVRPSITVSFGAGGNRNKQMPEQFEHDLIKFLCSRFARVVVDRGFGEEEASRTDRIIRGTTAQPWTGSFARFTSVIAQSGFYLGYDSAGQHAAAAFGVPLITLFKGYPSERMFARWQPTGPGPKRILRVDEATPVDSVIASAEAFFSQMA